MTRRSRWLRFATVGALGVGVQVATVGLLADRWHIDYLWSTVLGVLAAVAHNFAWHRHWTWRDRPDSRSVIAAFIAFAAGNGLVSLAGNLLVMRVLVGTLHLPAMAANLIAIAACAAANYLIADRGVFPTGTSGTAPRTRRTYPYPLYPTYPTYPSVYDRRHRPHDTVRPIGHTRSVRRVPSS